MPLKKSKVIYWVSIWDYTRFHKANLHRTVKVDSYLRVNQFYVQLGKRERWYKLPNVDTRRGYWG